MEIKKIAFADEGRMATAALVSRLPGFRDRAAAARDDLATPLDRSRRGFEALAALDRQYGGSGRIAVEGVEELLAAILGDLARVQDAALRLPDAALVAEAADFLVGVAIWAVRHAIPVEPLEPVVNALANRANLARSKPELAAAFALTQGILAHVAPRLAADLERSNPERPWRILHANLAITAIRTEDEAMMEHAFDALDNALPEERAGFYAEALSLALSPGVAPAVRERIEARHLKWTAAH